MVSYRERLIERAIKLDHFLIQTWYNRHLTCSNENHKAPNGLICGYCYMPLVIEKILKEEDMQTAVRDLQTLYFFKALRLLENELEEKFKPEGLRKLVESTSLEPLPKCLPF